MVAESVVLGHERPRQTICAIVECAVAVLQLITDSIMRGCSSTSYACHRDRSPVLAVHFYEDPDPGARQRGLMSEQHARANIHAQRQLY